ncbi:MAG TPA: carboxymuconolactone decarboxylase family protein [Mucilaginibacter sp.]|jgi:alkylhydroperoxidase/carboxymuconolactone decarboxylase family protein YurZ
MNTDDNIQTLDTRQQGIVLISAFTAKGNLAKLKEALNIGLDAGLTVNEIKEVLVQLYAYCGFPRSLNGIITFMSVLDEQKERGIKDIEGKEASPIKDSGDKYETGKKTLEILTKRAQTGPKTGPAAFAPIIDTFLKEHLFADIFSRDVLTYAERELTTISALTSLGGVEAQLQAHLGMGLNVGITDHQLRQLFTLIENSVGEKESAIGKELLLKVLASR